MNAAHVKMLEYVENVFIENGYRPEKGPYFKHKLHHTKRVVGWAQGIGEPERADIDRVLTMAIFHDVGYAFAAKDHNITGAELAEKYLKERGYQAGYIDEVCGAIYSHLDKSLLAPGTPINTLVLLEADNIDEKGAMALLWDAMAEGTGETPTYKKTFERITLHYERREQNRMVTPTARRFWEEKQEAVRAFLEMLEQDLYL